MTQAQQALVQSCQGLRDALLAAHRRTAGVLRTMPPDAPGRGEIDLVLSLLATSGEATNAAITLIADQGSASSDTSATGGDRVSSS